MNLIDILDIYALQNNSDELLLLFGDYTLDERVNRDILNSEIIAKLGAMRPITTDSELFKILFDNFFKKYSGNIKRLCDTLDLEYNPLYTKDIYHDLNENIQRDIGEEEQRHSVGDIDNTDRYSTNTDQTNTGTDTNEETVSAYDSPNYQPKKKSVETQNLRTDNDVQHSGVTTSDIVSDVDTNKSTDDDTARTLGEHTLGKDGDLPYQDLIEKQRKLVEFNIYNWIIKQMRKELFLLIY